MKLGFCLHHIGHSQLSLQFVTSANSYLESGLGVDVVGFVSNQLKPRVGPNFAVMNINEAFDFDGVVVATSLHTAERVVRFPGPKRRYFYVWDLEWVRQGGWPFDTMKSIYNHPDLTLVARHEEHRRVIEQCWNLPVRAVIPDCDVGRFVQFVQNDAKN